MSTIISSGSLRVGLVQMCSGRDIARNLRDATDLIRQAADGGASYVQTPEMTPHWNGRGLPNLIAFSRKNFFSIT